jgi:hypothetical protein
MITQSRGVVQGKSCTDFVSYGTKVCTLDVRYGRGRMRGRDFVPHTHQKKGSRFVGSFSVRGGFASVVLSVEVLPERSVHNFGNADAL